MTIFAILAERSGAVGIAFGWWAELQANRRAVAGLFLILVILAGDGVFLLRDAIEDKRAAYGHQLVGLQRIAAIAQEHDWPQRDAASAQARAQLEDRLWTADSDGIARADLQEWVTSVGREIGLSTLEVRIEAATPKSLPPDLRQITATITTQPTEAALIALLDRIERAPHVIVVDRLSVKQQPAPLLEMALTAYARIGRKTGSKPTPPQRSEPR